MNPHAVPSRMTMGQLMECIMGKAACHLGTYGDSTPFTDCSVETIANILERSGYERYGNEILYNGRTGQQIQTEIFIGPTYYQRLKHMVSDKAHCLTMDHEILTNNGWKTFTSLLETDEVAVLMNDELRYEIPSERHYYPNYKGQMYHISNQAIDLDVTVNHRMWVSKRGHELITKGKYKDVWKPYDFEIAEKLVGARVKYKKDAEWKAPDYQFILPAFKTSNLNFSDTAVDMDAWITFFGIYIAEGCIDHNGYGISIAAYKDRVKDAIGPAMIRLHMNLRINGENYNCSHAQINNYLRQFGISINKFLPDWAFMLSQQQARKLLHSLMLGDGHWTNTSRAYYTSSTRLRDDVQRLCLHAGYAGDAHFRFPAGTEAVKKDGYVIKSTVDSWCVQIHYARVNPTVNHGHTKTQEIQDEKLYEFEGPVFCLTVSSGVFLVRRNGKQVWTGNSRGSSGPLVSLTRQPAEGRARNGGLRFGEMERDAIVAHGASTFLKERVIDVSDNYRCHVCHKCGLICTANPERNIFKCNNCKNSAEISQIRIPYAMKLLIQELMSMSVAPRIVL
jgi:hypothetical protein